MGFEQAKPKYDARTAELRRSDVDLERLGIHAESLESEGLTIHFTVKGDLETRVRSMFNVINDHADDSSLSVAMMHVLNIACDATNLIEKNKSRVYP
jgi:hypothetical protein